MQIFKSALVVMVAAFALIASMTSASAALAGIAYPAGPPNGSAYTIPGSYEEGDTIALAANFPSYASGEDVEFYVQTAVDSTDYELVGADLDGANSTGDAYFKTYVADEPLKFFGQRPNGKVTNLEPLNPQTAPAPGTGTLTHSNAKTFTATFSPKAPGQKTELQWETIKTEETDETPEAKWVTIKSGTQDPNGKTVFTISDPREVTHKYRAKSGSTTTEIIEAAAPRPSKNTGLSQVHFDTYEGAKVNTRSRDFEGEFTMTASTRDASPNGGTCSAVAPMRKSRLKGRGNYSWSFDKKGFTLKLGKSTDVCGMGKSKKYALVANHYDRSLIRNTVAQNVGKTIMRNVWTPESTPVDFFMNGSFLGSYILIERIAVAPDRVNVPELKDEGQETNPSHPNNQPPNVSGGYVLEWDFRHGADRNFFAGDRRWVGIKEPENESNDEGISPQQFDYINDYADKADAALFGSNFKDPVNGWRKYIDGTSAVDYYIAMELLKPVDGNMWASVYMFKQRDSSAGANDGKLFMGPLWDFDLAIGSADRAGNVKSPFGYYLRNPLNVSAKQTAETWFNRLNEDATFRSAVNTRWRQIEGDLSQTSFINGQESLLSQSAAENYKRWSISKKISDFQVIDGSWSGNVDYVRRWMSTRISWLDGQWG